MAAVKNKLGRIPCDCCGHPVVLKENEAGTLTVSCDECDVSSFAKKGTAAGNRWRARLPAAGGVPKAPDPVEVKPAVLAPPGPVPKAPKANPFDPLDFLRKKT